MISESFTILKQYRKWYLLLMLSTSVVVFLASNINLYLAYLAGYAKYNEFTAALLNETFWWLGVNFLGSLFIYKSFMKNIQKRTEIELQHAEIRKLFRKSLAFIVFLCLVDFMINISFALASVRQEDLNFSRFLAIALSYSYALLALPPFYLYIAFILFLRNFFEEMFKSGRVIFTLAKNRIVPEMIWAFLLVVFFPIAITITEFEYMGYFKDITGEKLFIFGFFVQLLVALCLFIFFIRFVISRPVSRLLENFEKVRNGNYDSKIPITAQNELGKLMEGFNLMVDGLKDREFVRDTFGKYISPEVAELVLKGKHHSLSGEEMEATILFTDIEGYTTMVEKSTPSEIVELLNEYFNDILEIISRNYGVVNKFIGDAVLAFFNLPVADPNHSINAVKAAIEIIRLTNSKKYLEKFSIRTRIGINTGPVIAGNIGTKNRMEFTVIGDTVNIAQRLEAYNKELNSSILIGGSTFRAVKNEFTCKPAGEVSLKGKHDKIQAFIVEG